MKLKDIFTFIHIIALLTFFFSCQKENPDMDQDCVSCNCMNAGESRTYQVVGSTETITFVVEEVNELVAGYKVYRWRPKYDPPGLGQYLACDPNLGEIEVATDSWEVGNPSNNRRVFWEPPAYRCQYGDQVGTKCTWRGTLDGEPETVVSEVITYEMVETPYGSFDNAMKIIHARYDGNGEAYAGPNHLWYDQYIGLIKVDYLDFGRIIELKEYRP